jgi:polyhydroxyalkanoate synthesis regulator phasin
VPVPQRKNQSRASGSRRTHSRPSAAAAPTAPPSEPDQGLREQLLRFVNPLELVVLTRERVQEAFDEAVARGRLTRQDASDLVAELLQRGRRQTDDLLADLEQLATRTGPGDRMLRELDRARRATGLGPTFPISGYDDLTAAQVQARLGDLAPPELRRVRDYERRNANRKSVLRAIEQRLR